MGFTEFVRRLTMFERGVICFAILLHVGGIAVAAYHQ